MSTLDPKKLNEKIISLRKVIKKAKVHLFRHHVRAISKLKKLEKADNSVKIGRLEEELNAIKNIKPDLFSKMALVNTKTKNELLTNLKGKTPEERVEAKLLFVPVFEKEIDNFREKYPKWHQEVPFFLQRFGMIAKERKAKASGEETIVHN
uniref:CHAD domain-containing protein n=1 Tax=Strongyloides stercoralis TaxID=6248 RepID=A0A0K0E9K8_STRER